MNFKEGVKRSALLLGISGAAFGIYHSARELQNILAYCKFKSLANSYLVEQKREGVVTAFDQLQAKVLANQTKTLQNQKTVSVLDVAAATSAELDILKEHSWVNSSGISSIQWATSDIGDCSIYSSKAFTSSCVRIESIVTTDGKTYLPGFPPQMWSYVLVVLYPILGFLVPWGGTLSLAWGIAGFSKKAE